MADPDYRSKDARIDALRRAIARTINLTGDMRPNSAARKARLELKRALEVDDKVKGP